MVYEAEEAPDKNLGWITVAISAGTLLYNYATGTQKTKDDEFRALVLKNAAAREKVAIDKLNEEAEIKRAQLIEAVKKSMPVIGIILVASVVGGIMGKKK